MKILYLSPYPQLVDFLRSNGDEVLQTAEPLLDRVTFMTATETLTATAESLISQADFIVAYGYRFKISRDVVDRFKGRAVNLHISYLPWNRGADPNLWSFLEDTPKGVTIHYLDGNIDTGDVIVQESVEWQEGDTLSTTYQRLRDIIERLFREHWPAIREGNVKAMPQLTYHRSRDKDAYQDLLTKGWDTPICDILGKAVR